MNQKSLIIIEQLVNHHPELKVCQRSIEQAFELIASTYHAGGKVLVCGNGGSAADSDHIVGELMKGFLLKRRINREIRNKLVNAYGLDGEYLADHLQGSLPAISLAGHPALTYAFINDVASDMVFAQQVCGYGRKGDVLIALSTSGNSANVINAVKTAKAFDLRTIGLTGESGGNMKQLCDVVIRVPAKVTYQVQEYHLPIYHALCAMVEYEFFAE